MSYCLNPSCSNPQNSSQSDVCEACGASLLLRSKDRTYRVMQTLGQGGFGATFLAVDQSLPDQPCVIKQLRPSATAPHVLDMARELFQREAETLRRIGSHPQLPGLLDYFEANQEFYLVQEYVSGATLQQEIKKSGPLSESGVKLFLSEILPVLEYIHSNGVIHRDIKPANVIRRSQDGRLVLIDFGAVKHQNEQQDANASDQTVFTSYAIGTPGFAPPEQMAMRPVPASDVYALGVTCIYLLTAKYPKDIEYDPTTGDLLWERHVHISDHFIGVLKKMVDVSVRRRYQSANEIFRALDLEPYLESLEKGMLRAPGSTSKPRKSRFDIDSSDFPSSPIARAAMEIRARNLKSKIPNLQTGLSDSGINKSRQPDSLGRRRDITGNSRDFTGEKITPAVRLSQEELQSYYLKGKRDFATYDLSGLNLTQINLVDASFHQANLSGSNLQGANLMNVNLGRANLSRANLRDAILVKAYFSNADLEGADLRGADLSSAYLLNANLRGANLCGANLAGAKLTEDQLAVARTNWKTTRPDGRRGMWS